MDALARRSPALAALLALGACGDDRLPADPCEYAVCDITDADCARQVAEAVACNLDQDPIYPTVRMLSPAEYLAEQDAADPDNPSAAEQRDRDDYLRMQILVGLMPAGYMPADADADYLSNFAAFYSPTRKDIVILTGRKGSDVASDYIILVHEMTHAYQDAAHDLGTLEAEKARTWDRSLGLHALIEGGAVLQQNFAQLALSRIDVLGVDWGAYFADWQEESLERALASDTPALDTSAFFPYSFGGQFVFDAWTYDGPEGVEALFDQPPDSVRQVISDYSSWPDLVRNEDAQLDPHAVAVLPANYQFIGGGHEGVWSLNATLQRTAQGGLWTPDLSDVSADYLAAWRWNDDRVAAIWRIRSARRTPLLNDLTAGVWRLDSDVATTHVVAEVDDDLLLIAVSEGDARLVLADISGWQSPEEAAPGADAGAVRRHRQLGRRDLACAPPRPPRALTPAT